MHNVLIQCLIATIDKEFSPEEHKQLLDEQKNACTYEEWTEYWDIAKHIPAQRDALREKLGHPAPKYQQRQMVKEVLSTEAARAIEPRLPIKQHPQDETPVDWQPRSVSVKIV